MAQMARVKKHPARVSPSPFLLSYRPAPTSEMGFHNRFRFQRFRRFVARGAGDSRRAPDFTNGWTISQGPDPCWPCLGWSERGIACPQPPVAEKSPRGPGANPGALRFAMQVPISGRRPPGLQGAAGVTVRLGGRGEQPGWTPWCRHAAILGQPRRQGSAFGQPMGLWVGESRVADLRLLQARAQPAGGMLLQALRVEDWCCKRAHLNAGLRPVGSGPMARSGASALPRNQATTGAFWAPFGSWPGSAKGNGPELQPLVAR